MRFPLSQYPGMNPFVLDRLSGDARATQFLARASTTDLRGGHSRSAPELIDALERSNSRWGSNVGEELRKWAAGETVTIVAGQQTGFAGGPIYTLAKLASMLKLKQKFAAEGVPVTLFFWLATEDHDYAEAASLSVPVRLVDPSRKSINRQLELLTVRATRSPQSRRVVGTTPIPEALIAQLLSVFDMQRPSWLRPGITFGDSFAELCASAFDEPIVFVDSLLPELRHAGAPLFERVIERRSAMQESVSSRSEALSRAGYVPQILARSPEQYTFLFRLDDKGERNILGNDEGVGDPQTISTSALTRPLLQDFVFEPDIFVGGPAEVAYYAQLAPLHQLLGVRLPRVLLRGHALLAEKRVSRKLDRLQLEGREIFSSPDAILSGREPAGVAAIRELASEAQSRLLESLARIGELALPADHALARALNRSTEHIEYHFDKLTESAIRGLVRKDRERWLAVQEVVSTFYPDHHVQDRIVGWFPYWRQFGRELINRVVEEIEPDSDSFCVVSL